MGYDDSDVITNQKVFASSKPLINVSFSVDILGSKKLEHIKLKL